MNPIHLFGLRGDNLYGLLLDGFVEFFGELFDVGVVGVLRREEVWVSLLLIVERHDLDGDLGLALHSLSDHRVLQRVVVVHRVYQHVI